MSITELEQRVVALEQKVTHLTKTLEASTSQDLNAWIDEISGTFKEDATLSQGGTPGTSMARIFPPGENSFE
jgi:hypothetical protein